MRVAKISIFLILLLLSSICVGSYLSSVFVAVLYVKVLSPELNSTYLSVDLGELKAGESFSRETSSTLEIRNAVALNVTLRVSEQSNLEPISDLSIFATVSNETKSFSGYLPLSLVLSEGKYNVSLKITGRAGYPSKDSTAKIIIVAEAKEP